MPLKQMFYAGFLVTLSITALMGIGAFLFGSFGHFELRILGTTALLCLFSLTGLGCALVIEKGRAQPLAWLGIAASVASFVLLELAIWDVPGPDDDDWAKWGYIAMTLAIAITHSVLLLLAWNRRAVMAVVLGFTQMCLWVVAGLMIWQIWKEFHDTNEWWARALGVGSVFTALGTILTPIFWKLQGAAKDVPAAVAAGMSEASAFLPAPALAPSSRPAAPAPLKRIFLTAFIAALVVCALFAAGVFLFGTFRETELRMLATTGLVALFSLTGLSNAALLERGRLRPLAWTGIGMAIISFAAYQGILWESSLDDDAVWKIAIIGMILAIAIAHSGMILLARNGKRALDIVVIGTEISVWLATLILCGVILVEDGGEWVAQTLGVLSILGSVGTIATPIVRKLTADSSEKEKLATDEHR